MKRVFSFLVCTMLVLSLSACGGNVENVIVKDVESEIYTTEDINSAIDTVKNVFNKDWEGCTLKEIYYSGDENIKGYQDWADRNDADEVIVLLSSFDVDSTGGDGSLNPYSTYDNWNWILVRNTDGKWKHIDHGY